MSIRFLRQLSGGEVGGASQQIGDAVDDRVMNLFSWGNKKRIISIMNEG